MKVVVYPATMEMGGSTINALELAARVQARGHEVVVYGDDDVLVETARSMGLEWVPAGPRRGWPSRTDIWRLLRLVRARGIDVVHAYEGGPALDLAVLTLLTRRVTPVTTVMSMSVPYELPRHSDLFVGTHDLLTEAAATRDRVRLMVPPVDTDLNRPKDPVGARARLGIADGATCVSVVCRLTDELGKLAGVLAAVEAVDELAGQHDVQLLVVGGGAGLAALTAAAREVNERHGRAVVVVAGPMLDPRDAYDATDIALGMGSSALKAMSFAKPLVVQGDHGFWRLFEESSAPTFARTGMYGDGGDGAAGLTRILRSLLAEPRRWAGLGELGRDTVLVDYSLDHAVDQLLGTYEEALASPHPRSRVRRETAYTLRELVKCRVAQWDQRHTGGRIRAAGRRLRRVS